MSRTNQILITLSLMILSIRPSFGDWKENAKPIDISGGEDHTLVLTQNKWPWACGDNGWSELGIGNYEDHKTLVRVLGGDMGTLYLQGINDVDAGWKHSLALESYDPTDPNCNGYVWGWGDNFEGQLGIDSQDSKTSPVRVLRGEQTPWDPNDPNLARIIDISAGRSGEHSLAVDANGYAYAWGMNQEGQLGNEKHGGGVRELTPVKVKGVGGQGWLANIIAVSAGADHSMALEKIDPNLNGSVYTWGANKWPGDGEYYQAGSGKLGNGTAVALSDTPVRVLSGQQDPNHPYLQDIVAISAGWNHCMALEEYDPWDSNLNGRVYTWGSNGQGWGDGENPCSIGGRLGDGTTTDSNTPVLVLSGEQDPCSATSALEQIIAVSAGEAHSMALDVDGYVYTWGDNYHGQLGDGTNDQRLVPVRVVGQDRNRNGIHDGNEGYLENIAAIAAGYWHSLAIDSDGVVWVWGKTKDGRLGLANMANAPSYICSIPHRIPVVYNEGEEEFWFSINDAIDDPNTATGDVLEASWGVYYENVYFGSKGLTLHSQAGNFDVVSSTVIDGSYSWSSAASLFGNPGSTLAGFTVTNSYQHGIYEYACSGASVIRNNIIRGNIENGIYCHEFSYGSQIKNNWIYDNGASGIETCNPNAPLANAVIVNNTIVNNDGNGVKSDFAADVNITNCIIWDNGDDPNNDNLHADYGTFDVTYSCLQGSYAGTGGNIDSDPCFVDDVNDDYHLKKESPCVDTGDSSAVVDANEKDIDGNPREMGPEDPNDPNGRLVDMGADEDYPHCDDQYDDWVTLGRPNCWMTPYQCDGDANTDLENPGLKWRVSASDLSLVIANWKKPAGPTLNPCADIDHKWQNPGLHWRVSASDLSIVIINWKKRDKDNLTVPPSMRLPGDCAERGCQGEALGGGSPGTQLTSKELLQWLAEIWLDPDVRKSIDHDKFLKVYESLKELESSRGLFR